MEAAPSTKPRGEPPPIPPNYVSLKQLQELRLKDKEEEEKRRREEEEEEAAAVKRAAALKAEESAMAAAVKREPALKAEKKGRAVSSEAFFGAKERHRGGQGHQRMPVAHRAAATTPPTWGEVAAGTREWRVKKASSCHAVGEPGNLAGKAAPAASNGGKPENKGKIKAMGKASVAPLDPGKAAVASSPGHLTCKGRNGAGARSAETSPGDAPAKTAGPSPPRGLADAGTGRDSPEGKDAAPAQAAPTSAADVSRKPKSGGPLRKIMEAKPEGIVEGQRRQPVVVVQAVSGRNPRVARRSAKPWRGRGNGAAERHGRVWVPKAPAADGSCAGAGYK